MTAEKGSRWYGIPEHLALTSPFWKYSSYTLAYRTIEKTLEQMAIEEAARQERHEKRDAKARLASDERIAKNKVQQAINKSARENRSRREKAKFLEAARVEREKRWTVPEGYVDIKGAVEMYGISDKTYAAACHDDKVECIKQHSGKYCMEIESLKAYSVALLVSRKGRASDKRKFDKVNVPTS